ncbi:MAG TPA: nitrile hydratase subunit beta, partial [Stellaceae bacterium]|nr:nitrile hydratase subunit beta [Stellaceae bacterium]
MSNTVHDMGGMHGFGPVVAEPSEPPFHEAWEGRVLAMQRAMGFTRLWTIDGGRASLESLPPVTYLASSYYERWFLGLEKRVVAHGLVGEDEIAAGRSLRPGIRLNRKLTAADVPRTTTRGNFERPAPGPARFKAGDRVRTRNINPK